MYSGTSLIAQPTKDEVNRGILDLLKKINELSARIEKLEKADFQKQINELSARIEKLEGTGAA